MHAVPELPDIELYLHALRPRLLRQRLDRIRIASPFLVRTTAPPVEHLQGRRVQALSRLGKRLVFHFEGDASLVLHLMVAGRLRWADQSGAPIPKKIGLAALDVTDGTLLITEAGSTRRASLHVVPDAGALVALDPGGLDLLTSDFDGFSSRLTAQRHTLKRALTDPSIFSGIGNAYSDEILHRARLSPFRLTDALSADELHRLHEAAVAVLAGWRDTLIREAGTAFPTKVTAFRSGWPSMGATTNRAPPAAHWSNVSATRRMRRTTARSARPAADCSLTARSRDCLVRIGPGPSTIWSG
jgi:formamidopyrimidine-DNA glycosylase